MLPIQVNLEHFDTNLQRVIKYFALYWSFFFDFIVNADVEIQMIWKIVLLKHENIPRK